MYWIMACCVYVCTGKEFSVLDDGVLCVCVYTFGRSLIIPSSMKSRVTIRITIYQSTWRRIPAEWNLHQGLRCIRTRSGYRTAQKRVLLEKVLCARSVLTLSFHLGGSGLCLPKIYCLFLTFPTRVTTSQIVFLFHSAHITKFLVLYCYPLALMI